MSGANRMRITIVGPGSLGGLLGGLMARKGEDVSFVARREALRIIRDRGLNIRTPTGDFTTGPLQAAESPTLLGPADLVLVAVKSWQVKGIAASLRPLLGGSPVVDTLKNGVEAADHLLEALGTGPVVGGLAHVISSLDGPAQVVHRGNPPEVTLGELEGPISARLRKIAPVLEGAGVVTRLSENIRRDLWEKLL